GISGRPAYGGMGGLGGGFGGGLGGGGPGGGLGGGLQGGAALGTPGAAVLGQQQPPPAAPPAQAQNPLLGPLEPGAGGAEINAEALRIIPDPQNNALLVYGTQREAATIQAVLRKIDILPLQVRIDAVIAEVQLNDNLQYGTQFFFKAGGLNGILNFATQQDLQTPSQAQLNLNFPGFFLGSHGAGGAPFALNALQNVTTV